MVAEVAVVVETIIFSPQFPKFFFSESISGEKNPHLTTLGATSAI